MKLCDFIFTDEELEKGYYFLYSRMMSDYQFTDDSFIFKGELFGSEYHMKLSYIDFSTQYPNFIKFCTDLEGKKYIYTQHVFNLITYTFIPPGETEYFHTLCVDGKTYTARSNGFLDCDPFYRFIEEFPACADQYIEDIKRKMRVLTDDLFFYFNFPKGKLCQLPNFPEFEEQN